MKSFLFSFKYAFAGIMKAFISERNLRIHFVAIIVVTSAGLYFEITNNQWLAQLLTIGLVVSLELINTAIEDLVDLVSPDHNDLAGRVKDVSSGAVLFASIVAIIVAIVIYGPIFLNFV